jgi:solute carrier family 35 protein E3
MQLLYYQAPMSAVLLMFVVPFFEPLTGSKGVFSSEWTMEGLVSSYF